MGVDLVSRMQARAGDEDRDLSHGLGQRGFLRQCGEQVPHRCPVFREVQHCGKRSDQGAVSLCGGETMQVGVDAGFQPVV